MLSRIEFQNYRSFLDVGVNLSPFTLVIGANGSGKSNFLCLFRDLACPKSTVYRGGKLTFDITREKHFNHQDDIQLASIYKVSGDLIKLSNGNLTDQVFTEESRVGLFNLNTSSVDHSEQIQMRGQIDTNGKGIITVLDDLKTGDREDLFDEIQTNLIRYIPSIEKLSLRTAEPGKKSLQVREKGIEKPFPVAELSEGTKLILMILTILYQENPPKLILLEDIDRGLHPRLFQKVVEMMRDIVKTKDVQIIATTHNPYLVDEFTGEEESVLIVEKKDTVSTITSLAERLDKGDTMEDALGSLWFSGFFGGVPTSS